MNRQHFAVPGILALGVIVAASNCPVTNKTMTVGAGIMNEAQVSGVVDQNNSCAPPSTPAPDPVAWFNAPGMNQSQAVVGFQVWRNLANNGACLEHKDIAYRGFFKYDITAVAALKTMTKATITFVTHLLPPDATVDAHNLCDSRSGGLGSLWLVTPQVQFAPGMILLPPSVPNGTGFMSPSPFPPGQKLVAFTLPWVAGAIGANTTTAVAGATGASWTIDVTGPMNQAIAANQTAIQFMLSSSDEAFPRQITPPASVDCRTTFTISEMTVTYVGN